MPHTPEENRQGEQSEPSWEEQRTMALLKRSLTEFFDEQLQKSGHEPDRK